MRVILVPPGNSSHVLLLAEKLLEMGVIRRGEFNWVEFLHDGWCPAMYAESNHNLHCRCNVEAVIGGSTFSFEQLVGAS